MKKRNLFVTLFASSCLSLAPLVGNAQAIEPFGDSVTTFGANPQSSYRYWLYVDLTNAGYSGFTFIGTSSGVQNGTPANSWPDEAYSGFEGWQTSDALRGTPAAINVSGGPANIVLLDFGANDVNQLNNALSIPEILGQTRTNLDAIIQDFAQANSGVVILLAKPTGWSTTDPVQKKFMSQLGGAISKAASDEKKAGVSVVVVDLFGGYNVRTDTVDGTHPNVKGEQQIAKKFFNALRPVLKKMGVVPLKPRKG
jgi:acyl-CoA thioesterase-1